MSLEDGRTRCRVSGLEDRGVDLFFDFPASRRNNTSRLPYTCHRDCHTTAEKRLPSVYTLSTGGAPDQLIPSTFPIKVKLTNCKSEQSAVPIGTDVATHPSFFHHADLKGSSDLSRRRSLNQLLQRPPRRLQERAMQPGRTQSVHEDNCNLLPEFQRSSVERPNVGVCIGNFRGICDLAHTNFLMILNGNES